MDNTSLQDILISARRKLIASPLVSPLIGSDIGTDRLDSELYSGFFNDGWIFYGVGDSLAPERDPENVSTSSISMGFRRPWTSPNDHNTARFRELAFVVYSDQTRPGPDSTGLLGRRDAEDRCYRVSSAIIEEFNDPGNRVHWWGDVYIVSCLLYNDVIIRDEIGKDGVVRGDFSLKLILG